MISIQEDKAVSAKEYAELLQKLEENEIKNKKLSRELRLLQKKYELDRLNRTTTASLTRAMNREKARQEMYVSLLLQNCAEIIIVLDERLRFLMGSSSISDIINIEDIAALQGRTLEDVLSHDQEIEHAKEMIINACEEAANSKEHDPKTIEIEIKGIFYLVRIQPFAKSESDFTGLVVVMSDVTELTNAKDRATKASVAKDKFLSHMSHEMRTPLNSILGLSELQLQKENHDRETEESFWRIHNSSSLLLSIINDILDLSKVEAGKMEVVPAVYDVANMIVDTTQLNMMLVGEKPIEFRLEIDKNLPKRLIGDELRIKQLLNNVLSNGFKYTPKGEVSLEMYPEENSEKPGYINLIAKIKDTGQGLSADQLEGVFGEFARYNEGYNKNIEGSGLGLTIVHKLITMMEGRIIVESALGVGSTFTLVIPQKISGDAVLGEDVAKSLQSFQVSQKSLKRMKKFDITPMPYGRVLVVDDVESNLFVAKGFLLPYRLSVETVDSGLAAIELIEKGEVYDLIFMDHMMPDLDGMQTTKALREMGYGHPIVALTANAFSDSIKMFMENGFSGYASKPIDFIQIDKVLKEFVMARHPEAAAMVLERVAFSEATEISSHLRETFLRDAAKIIDVLEGGNGLKEFVVCIHGAKSALYNIKQPKLAEMASDLEAAGRANDQAFVDFKAPAFLIELKKVVAQMQNQKEETAQNNDYDAAALRNLLETIHTASENFDFDLLNDTIDEMNKNTYPQNIQLILDEISNNVLSGDYEDAGFLAQNVIGGLE